MCSGYYMPSALSRARLRPHAVDACSWQSDGGMSFPGCGVAERCGEPEGAAGGVCDAPQPAMRGLVGLILPGMGVGRAAAGVQVMDEQRCHEDLAGVGFEDLDAKAVRTSVRSCQRPVL